MTEQGWMTSTDPQTMLREVTQAFPAHRQKMPPLASDRKLRLFACACCRQVWDGVPCKQCGGDGLCDASRRMGMKSPVWGHECSSCHGTGHVGGLTDPRSRRAVEVAERYADGLATETELDAASKEVAGVRGRTNAPMWCCAPFTDMVLRNAPGDSGVSHAIQASLLRCIFGNPFRPVTYHSRGGRAGAGIDPLWRSATVLAVARSIYQERRFADLGILADALEEAGCEAEVACPECGGHGCKPFPSRQEFVTCRHCRGTGRVPNPLLAHLRQTDGPCAHRAPSVEGVAMLEYFPEGCPFCGGTGRVLTPHARGCWVLDLILGK